MQPIDRRGPGIPGGPGTSIDEDPWLSPRPRPIGRVGRRWIVAGVVGCALPLALGLAALVALGIAVDTGRIPDSEVVEGERVGASTRAFLAANGMLEPGERIERFYSAGFLDAEDEGAFFTDRRVVAYARVDGELAIEQARHADVIRVDAELAEGWLESSLLAIETADPDGAFELALSTEGGGDREFHARLRATWLAARRAVAPAFDAEGGARLEDQLAVIARLGIAPRAGLDLAALLELGARAEYERQPFELLLAVLGEAGVDLPGEEQESERTPAAPVSGAAGGAASDDAWLFGWLWPAGPASVARLAERMRALADGALPLADAALEVDEPDVRATLAWSLDGERASAPVGLDEGWLDESALAPLVAAHEARAGGTPPRIYAGVWLEDRGLLIVAIEPERLRELRTATAIAFEPLAVLLSDE